MKFEDFGFSLSILEVIKKEGFEEPTEIQEKCIPEIKKGKDVVGQSVTGSGKTVAFAIPVLEMMTPDKGIQTLVLTPTRELCMQVKDTFSTFGRSKRINTTAIYGGADMSRQIRDVKRTDVVVATPGRLLDHIKRKTIDLKNIKYLILDEVDKMFEMGFKEDVDRILKSVPKQRQTILFSATLPPKVESVVRTYLNAPVIIKGQTRIDKSKLNQIYFNVNKNFKLSLLLNLVKREASGLSLVFCATRREVDNLAFNLKNHGVDAMAIHGGLRQNQRTHALNSLKIGNIQVLVATDVAARGLDIKDVTHVYNYDVPQTSEDYVHRVGRTARAGKNGEAVTLLTDRDYDNFRNVLSDKTLNIISMEIPKDIETVMFERAPPSRDDNGRGNRRTSSYGSRGGSGGSSGGFRRGSGPSDGSRRNSGSSYGAVSGEGYRRSSSSSYGAGSSGGYRRSSSSSYGAGSSDGYRRSSGSSDGAGSSDGYRRSSGSSDGAGSSGGYRRSSGSSDGAGSSGGYRRSSGSSSGFKSSSSSSSDSSPTTKFNPSGNGPKRNISSRGGMRKKPAFSGRRSNR
ncbi:MAG: DEAD/DEAH box helicase [DPANN group archaeon]|nr:DEAD/DEAH box helicase [DPANN group archaeon]